MQHGSSLIQSFALKFFFSTFYNPFLNYAHATKKQIQPPHRQQSLNQKNKAK